MVGQSITCAERIRVNQLIAALEASANRQLMIDYGYLDAGVTTNGRSGTPILTFITSLPQPDAGAQALYDIFNTTNPNTGFKYGDISASGALDLNDSIELSKFAVGLTTDNDYLQRIRILLSMINSSPYKQLIAAWGYVDTNGRDEITLKSGTNITVSASDTKEITVTGSSTPSFSSIDHSGTTGSGDIGSSGNTFGTAYLTGVSVSSITKTGTTGVGDIGQSSNRFGTFYGTATSALYADLAELYKPDANYDPGTVVSFGGEEEITVSREFMDRRIAGVISTNPAYLMNDNEGAGIPVALQGRVPCKVVGKIRKGDMLVASGMVPGVATAEEHPALGSVIGKALENYDSQTIGLIEVVVGRI